MALSRPALVDPILDALARAPRVLAMTPEQRAELEQDLVEIAAGRAVLTPHDDVPQVLEEMYSER